MKKILLLLWVLVGLYGLSWANNFGSSFENKEASVTFTHTSALDSAWVVFGYDGDAGESDTANFYDSIRVLPVFSGDGKLLFADGLELDSIGVHIVRIWGFASDAIAVISAGIWLHENDEVDMVMISGDPTAADNAEYFFDGTGITQDVDIKVRSFEAESDVGHAFKVTSTAAGYSGGVMWGKHSGLQLGTSATSGSHYGLYIYPSAPGVPYDIYLGQSGRIHGTIDSVTAAALGSADADTLAVIRNYTHAVIETVTAHAPHGDNWAAGTGVSAIADTVNAILDTLQAHAPHADDWSGSGAAGADTSEFKALIQNNWDSDTDGELTVEPHGTGTRTVVIQCLDYTDSTTGISSVMIDVYDSTGGEYKQPLQSNTAGLCTLSLDDGRYTIHLKKTADAVSGGSPQYRGVSSDTTHTFYIDQFDPGAPPSADMCRVWCIAYDLENNEVPGVRLTIQVPGRFMPLVYDGTPVSRYTRSAVSNDTGYVHIDIYEMEGANRIKCEADTSLTVKANIELRFPTGEVIRTYKAIPDASDWEVEW